MAMRSEQGHKRNREKGKLKKEKNERRKKEIWEISTSNIITNTWIFPALAGHFSGQR